MASFSLPADFLSGPAPNLQKEVVDFAKTDLPEYKKLYAAVLDGCFTKEECDLLVQAAIAQTNNSWETAMINAGYGQQMLATDVRNSDRIMWDDRDIVARLWNRIASAMDDIDRLNEKPLVMGWGPVKRKEVWQFSRLNERMRFLKYGPGQYFKTHMDGAYATPDNEEISFFTLHLYLNESTPDVEGGKLEGGATSFESMDVMDRKFDVDPKIGRVLIFQHKGLLHCGADVTKGMKLTMRTDLMYRRMATTE